MITGLPLAVDPLKIARIYFREARAWGAHLERAASYERLMWAYLLEAAFRATDT